MLEMSPILICDGRQLVTNPQTCREGQHKPSNSRCVMHAMWEIVTREDLHLRLSPECEGKGEGKGQSSHGSARWFANVDRGLRGLITSKWRAGGTLSR